MRNKGLKGQDIRIPDNGEPSVATGRKGRVMNTNLSGVWRNSLLLMGAYLLCSTTKGPASYQFLCASLPLEPLRNARYDKPPDLRRTHEFLMPVVQ